MEIIIAGETYKFSDSAEVRIGAVGYELYITDPGYSKDSEVLLKQFTSKAISLPGYIENMVRRTSLSPCSKVFKDATGKQRLYTYFD